MAEKLKSVLGPIHWSLLLKALAASGVWLLSPNLAALFVAVIYFLPPYKNGAYLLPFFVLEYVLLNTQPSLLLTLLIGVAVYTLLGVKNLILIDRATSFQACITLLFFFLWALFFEGQQEFYSLSILLTLVGLSLLFYLLSAQLVRLKTASTIGHHRLVLGLGAFLMFEWALVTYFLPLPVAFQTALALLATGFLLECLSQYLVGSLARKNAITYFSVFLPLFVMIVIISPWGI